MIFRIDHVSIAVKDFKKAEKFFTTILDLKKGGAGSDDGKGFFYQVYSAGDLSRFEIITPTREGSFLDNFLRKKEGGVHHITFQVEDIYKVKKALEVKCIPYFGFNDRYDNWKELYIHPVDAFGVLIQIAEFNPSEWIDGSMKINNGKKWFIGKKEGLTRISFSHPGGGKVDLDLTENELNEFIKDLKK